MAEVDEGVQERRRTCTYVGSLDIVFRRPHGGDFDLSEALDCPRETRGQSGASDRSRPQSERGKYRTRHDQAIRNST